MNHKTINRDNAIAPFILVIIQFTCLGYMVISGPLISDSLVFIIPTTLGVAIFVWAVITLGARNLRALPTPAQDGTLVQKGPFRFIRHPMYMSGLLIVAAWLAITPRWDRLGAGVVLAITLWIKMRYEESLLLKKYPEYGAYQKKTKRLIPFLY